MKCPICGANVEVTVFSDGTTLTRRDCMCSQVASAYKEERTDVVKSSQLGFEVPEDEAKV